MASRGQTTAYHVRRKGGGGDEVVCSGRWRGQPLGAEILLAAAAHGPLERECKMLVERTRKEARVRNPPSRELRRRNAPGRSPHRSGRQTARRYGTHTCVRSPSATERRPRGTGSDPTCHYTPAAPRVPRSGAREAPAPAPHITTLPVHHGAAPERHRLRLHTSLRCAAVCHAQAPGIASSEGGGRRRAAFS